MNTQEIINLYVDDRWSLRMLAEKFNTDHHSIKRKLIKAGVTITRRNTLKEFTQEHKNNISKARKKLNATDFIPYNKGLKTADRLCKNGTTGKELLYMNMKSHLRFDVTFEWLIKFDDFDKLKELNVAITPRSGRYNLTSDEYVAYIEKFYVDEQFNKIYKKWIDSGKLRYMRPSLDHVTPKAYGGNNALKNLQFLTWFENRCKNDMSQNDWDKLKNNIGDYFI